MELIIAETAGFCMGVDMALHKLDQAIASPPQNGRIHTLGPIIHNPQVLERYQSQGVSQTDGSNPLGRDDIVVIRAHGIRKQVQERFEDLGVRLVDATCPKVKKAQILIQKQADQGKHRFRYAVLLHDGDRGTVHNAAEDFNLPLQVTYDEGCSAEERQLAPLLEIEGTDVTIEAIKGAENGQATIVRLWQTTGCEVTRQIALNENVERACLTDLLEQELAPVPITKGKIELVFKPFEILTLKIES